MPGRPAAVTLPLVAEDSVHVDDVVPTASDVVLAPVTVMPVTLDAGRDPVAPFTVMVTFDPDAPIETAFVVPFGATIHAPRNATEVEPLADVLASIGADAVIATTPASDAVTVTEHVPSAAVTQDLAPRVAVVGVAPKETVVPAAAVPSLLTVAVRFADAPASMTAGPDTATFTVDVGVGLGVGLALGVGLTLGVGEGDAGAEEVALGLGDGLGVCECVSLGKVEGLALCD